MVAVLWRCRCARLLSRLFSGRCLWPHGCSGRRRILLRGRAAVCAGGRRPARVIATREPAARSGRSRGPPWPCRRPPAPRPGPASGDSPVPSGPSGALHTGTAALLMCGWVSRLEARPGLATTHGRRSLALRSLRRPPHRRRRVAVCGWARWLEARPGPAAALRHRGLALRSLRRPPCQWGWLGALACCLARSCCLLSASRGVSRVEFLGWSGACCYKRRQSEVFLVWISDPLLQTSSIRGLFR